MLNELKEGPLGLKVLLGSLKDVLSSLLPPQLPWEDVSEAVADMLDTKDKVRHLHGSEEAAGGCAV